MRQGAVTQPQHNHFEKEQLASERHKGSILIVDDTLANIKILFNLLRQSGFRVSVARSGKSGLAKMQETLPNLILLDVRMPEMDGFETCRRIKSNPITQDIPVIFLSAYDEVLDRVKAFDVGGVDYITKPFYAEEVLARVQNQISLQAAKTQVDQLNTELEARVQDRTAQLAAAICALEREIADRKRAEQSLQQLNAQLEIANHALARANFDQETIIQERTAYLRRNEARLRRIVDSNMIGILFVDAQGTIREANDAFLQLSGYTSDELLMSSNTLWNITPSDHHKTLQTAFGNLRESGVSQPWEQDYLRKDQSRISAIVGSALLSEVEKDIVCFVLDISKRKETEDQIKAALQEKDVLLAEIHHRVKNNLQVIASLLRLQAQRIHNPIALDAFEQSQNRIMAMAMIHQKLYESQNFVQIDLAQYVHDLTTELFRAYEVNCEQVSFQIYANNVFLNLNTAIPCGLIINELVTNALKYGFPDGRTGFISIHLSRGDDATYTILVRDDGVGLPDHLDMQKPKTFGLNLVRVLVRQLRGDIAIDSSSGTAFTVTFLEPS